MYKREYRDGVRRRKTRMGGIQWSIRVAMILKFMSTSVPLHLYVAFRKYSVHVHIHVCNDIIGPGTEWEEAEDPVICWITDVIYCPQPVNYCWSYSSYKVNGWVKEHWSGWALNFHRMCVVQVLLIIVYITGTAGGLTALSKIPACNILVS